LQNRHFHIPCYDKTNLTKWNVFYKFTYTKKIEQGTATENV